MKLKAIRIFAIRRKERWLALFSCIVFCVMNALLIYAHFDKFTEAKNGNVGAWSLFNNQLHFSGYDPYAYMTLTQYSTYYELGRHPLITALLYPFYLLNHFIMTTWDFNASMFIMSFLVVIASTYSVLFMYRTLNEVMKLNNKDSIWLTSLLFSFASIMTSAMSPDHFIFSLFLLTLSVYIFGRCLVHNKHLEWWKGAILYLFTTGITLTNGVKTLLGMLFVNGKKGFRWRSVLIAFVIPTALLLGAYIIQYEALTLPRKEKSEQIIALRISKDPSQAKKDSIVKEKTLAITGKRVSDKPFLKWIDLDSSRLNGIIEALFGESFQLHQDYLLGDIYLGRPAVVHYRSFLNYAVNGIIVLLFIAGIVMGRHRRIIQMLLSWLAVDLMIHVVLGFGLNEANINGTHWMFFIPIAIACLYSTQNIKALNALRSIVAVLTVYLWCYNGSLIIKYLV